MCCRNTDICLLLRFSPLASWSGSIGSGELKHCGMNLGRGVNSWWGRKRMCVQLKNHWSTSQWGGGLIGSICGFWIWVLLPVSFLEAEPPLSVKRRQLAGLGSGLKPSAGSGLNVGALIYFIFFAFHHSRTWIPPSSLSERRLLGLHSQHVDLYTATATGFYLMFVYPASTGAPSTHSNWAAGLDLRTSRFSWKRDLECSTCYSDWWAAQKQMCNLFSLAIVVFFFHRWLSIDRKRA